MGHARLNHHAVLHVHEQAMTDGFDLVAVAREFTGKLLAKT
jgi:hypothetical protein